MKIGARGIYEWAGIKCICEKVNDFAWELKVSLKKCCSNCLKEGTVICGDESIKILPGQDKP